ncbi:uncharacterized protein [Argopecten irradians]|uniref:uncharacterized protein n=1 Tax=Argopecten irradians TaxID=31199 RepID=UPI003720CA64
MEMDNYSNDTFPDVNTSPKERILSVAFTMLAVISTISFAEHCIVMLIVCVNKTLRAKPTVMSILLLSLSDIFLSVSLFLRSLNGQVPLHQTWMCGMTYFLIQLGFVTSGINTLTICIERYLCTKPIPSQPLSLRKRISITLISLGISSFIFGIPYLFTVKTTTIPICSVFSLFEENTSYAIAPVRSTLFLLWLGTIVVYAKTAKSFRRFMKVGLGLKKKSLMKGTTTRQIVVPDSQIVLPSCSTKATITVKGAKEHMDFTDIDATTVAKNLQVITTSKTEVGERQHYRNTSNCQFIETSSTIKLITKQKNDEIEAVETLPVEDGDPKPIPATNKSSVSRGTSKGFGKQSQAQPKVANAFRILSVVFVVFLISMTGQCVFGLVMLVLPMPVVVEIVCGVLSTTTVFTNPIMYALILKDFRKILKCTKR